MFRRNTPTPPPDTPPPRLPTGIRLPVPGVTPIRSTAPSPRTPTPPRSGTTMSRPDTPQVPIAFGPNPVYFSFSDIDGLAADMADSDNMDWAGTPLPSSPPAQTASSPLAPPTLSNQITSMSPTNTTTLIPLLYPMPPHPQTRAQIRETLIQRLTTLIDYPTPPTYALLQRRLSQIRTFSTTLTLFSLRNGPQTVTPDNDAPTPLDNLILEEYRTYLANEAATQQRLNESTPDPGPMASNEEAVERAMAEFTIRLRSMMRGESDAGLAFTSAVVVARDALTSMLPNGPAWTRDEAGSTVGVDTSDDAAANRRSSQRREEARRRFTRLLNAGPAGFAEEALQGTPSSVGSVSMRRERLDDSDSSTASGPSQGTVDGDGAVEEVLRLIGGPSETYRSRRVRQSRNTNPRSAGVSTRVWPDARIMTAEEIAEYNRVARREDREEQERIDRQREEQRRRAEEEEEEEEEARMAAVREQVGRRLRDAVEEEMREGPRA